MADIDFRLYFAILNKIKTNSKELNMTSFYLFIGTLLAGFIFKAIGIFLFQSYGNANALVISTLIDKYIIQPLVIVSFLWMGYDLIFWIGTYIYN